MYYNQNDITSAIVNMGCIDLDRLAELCNQYQISPEEVVENADDKNDINSLFYSVLSIRLNNLAQICENLINSYNGNSRALAFTFSKKLLKFLTEEAYETIYCNCYDSSFDNELLQYGLSNVLTDEDLYAFINKQTVAVYSHSLSL